ncbi:MAG: hypothetical protein ACFFG0_51900 [Candidatus Thorarchaeota archaeon]
MTESIDLKSLEKKAYRSTFNDGLWDSFIGVIILNLGFGPVINLLFNLPELWYTVISSLIFCVIGLLIFILGKKYITVPRIGYVKFGKKRKSKQLKLKIFLLIMLAVNMILVILPLTGILNYVNIQPFLITLMLGFGVFTLPLSVVAYFLDFTRLYYYAFSVGIGLFLTDLLTPIIGAPFDIIIIFCPIGGIIILIGLGYLISFLKKYPLSN